MSASSNYNKSENLLLFVSIFVSIFIGALCFNLDWLYQTIERNQTVMIFATIISVSPILLAIFFDKVGTADLTISAWCTAAITTLIAYNILRWYKSGKLALFIASFVIVLLLAGLCSYVDGLGNVVFFVEWAAGLFLAIRIDGSTYNTMKVVQNYQLELWLVRIVAYVTILVAAIIHIVQYKKSKT